MDVGELVGVHNVDAIKMLLFAVVIIKETHSTQMCALRRDINTNVWKVNKPHGSNQSEPAYFHHSAEKYQR